jgi:hypothetical protein
MYYFIVINVQLCYKDQLYLLYVACENVTNNEILNFTMMSSNIESIVNI